MNIVAEITKLDTQFKRGLITASDYSWQLQQITRDKCEELDTTYTMIVMVAGEKTGGGSDMTWPELCAAVACVPCSGEFSLTPCADCAVDQFLSELNANGKAVIVEQDPFGSSVTVAYRNQ